MKARQITIRKPNSNIFEAYEKWPKYYAFSRGEILDGYEVVETGKVLDGDYYFENKRLNGLTKWTQAIGAIGSPVISFKCVCRPKKSWHSILIYYYGDMNLSFIVPDKFDETHLDKLFKGMSSRFRFNAIQINQKDNVIIIGFTQGNTKMGDHISDYVNGFFDAI